MEARLVEAKRSGTVVLFAWGWSSSSSEPISFLKRLVAGSNPDAGACGVKYDPTDLPGAEPIRPGREPGRPGIYVCSPRRRLL